MEIIRILFLGLLVLFEAVLLFFGTFIFISGFISKTKGAPYVPLPKKSLKGVLTFAGLKEGGIFFDLGSGDGRILIESVREFGISKGVGYEVSPWPYLKSIFLLRFKKLKEKISIYKKDFLKADLTQAENIFIYLYPKIVQKSASKFKEELSPGSKIISVSFPIAEPEKFNLRLIKSGGVDRFNVFVYQKI